MQEEHPDPLNSPNISLDVGRTLFVKNEKMKNALTTGYPAPCFQHKDHLTTFRPNLGNDQISSYKISPIKSAGQMEYGA